MLIGVDLRCLPADGAVGAGVAHAARALVQRMVSLSGTDMAWILYLPRGATWELSGREQSVTLEQTAGSALRRALREHRCNLLFVPSGAVAPGLAIPVIPWVHDVAIFQHPDWFAESFMRRVVTTRLFRRGLERARHILAVSEFTRRELMELLRLEATRITVTGEGGDELLSTLQGVDLERAKHAARARLVARGLPHPFILFLGTLEPRKNLPTLLEAWARVSARFIQPTDLIIAGQDGWKLEAIQHALAAVRKNCLSSATAGRVHRLISVSDQERRDLLLAAELVAIPSWYEGFGLVAVEAMQAGTAVVASEVGAVPEVVGDAGWLLSAQDVEAWSNVFLQLINDAPVREQLAQAGKLRSQDMTWTRTAQVVLNALMSGPMKIV